MGFPKISNLITLLTFLGATIPLLVSAAPRYHAHEYLHIYEDEGDRNVGEQRCNGLTKIDTCAPGGFWETRACQWPLPLCVEDILSGRLICGKGPLDS